MHKVLYKILAIKCKINDFNGAKRRQNRLFSHAELYKSMVKNLLII